MATGYTKFCSGCHQETKKSEYIDKIRQELRCIPVQIALSLLVDVNKSVYRLGLQSMSDLLSVSEPSRCKKNLNLILTYPCKVSNNNRGNSAT